MAIVCSPHGPEPIGDRQEAGLKDRLQHQLQRRLDHPIGHGCNTEASHLSRPAPVWGSYVPAPAVAGTYPSSAGHAGLHEPPDTDALFDIGDPQAVDARRVRAPVARDPVKRHDQRRRIMHEVEQIIEPAARISRRPTVKLGLHPDTRDHAPYGLSSRAPAFTGASFGIAASFPSRNRCRPSPCDRLSRPRTTTAAPPRPGPISRRWAQPSYHTGCTAEGRTETVPRVHLPIS